MTRTDAAPDAAPPPHPAPDSAAALHPATRGTIHLEEAEILAHEQHAGRQHTLRLAAPRAAASAVPGSFAHITCDPAVPMRRPLSIMRADRDAGWIELLYKPIGAGLDTLTRRRPGEHISVLAPIGNGFSPDAARPRVIGIGGGVGIPPMIFAAEHLHAQGGYTPVVLMGSELPFPFPIVEAQLTVYGMPASATHAVAALEARGIASRLASAAGLEGAYNGFVTTLARDYLDALHPGEFDRTQILACGPEPMLRATAALAEELHLPCQLALEEYMACGVGGCAGCTVQVMTPEGPAMKRVCVDGPVFDSRAVYP